MTTEFANNASTTLTGTHNGTTTTINVASDTAFPAVSSPDFFHATIEDTSGNVEIIKVTNHVATSNVFTAVRGQDSTTGLSWVSGDLIEMRLTRVDMEELRDHNHDTVYGALGSANTWTDANTFSNVANFSGTLQIGGVAVTSTATELNILDDVTRSTADINALVTLTGAETLTNKELTTPDINGKPGYGLVILDTPEQLVATSTQDATISTWHTYNMSGGGTQAAAAATAGATKAILRVYQESSVSGNTLNSFGCVQKNGLGGNSTQGDRVVSTNFVIGGATLINIRDTNDVVVNLDASSDFEYQNFVTTASSTTWLYIQLIGYYV